MYCSDISEEKSLQLVHGYFWLILLLCTGSFYESTLVLIAYNYLTT
jgi:hypothetical protein